MSTRKIAPMSRTMRLTLFIPWKTDDKGQPNSHTENLALPHCIAKQDLVVGAWSFVMSLFSPRLLAFAIAIISIDLVICHTSCASLLSYAFCCPPSRPATPSSVAPFAWRMVSGSLLIGSSSFDPIVLIFAVCEMARAAGVVALASGVARVTLCSRHRSS